MNTYEERPGDLPAVAKVSLQAPFQWLAGGFSDFTKAVMPCLVYGFAMALVSALITFGILFSGYAQWIMILVGGFFFVAPMLAMGLYEAGRRIEKGETPRLGDMIFVRTSSTLDLAYLGLALVLFYFLWTRIGQIVYGLSTYQVQESAQDFLRFMFTDPEGWNMMMTGTIAGGFIAFVAFSLVVISAPMLLNQRVVVFLAIITSVRAVTTNFLPMLLWAALIVILTLASMATGFLAMIVVFPVIGLATWRAYRDLVPSSAADV